MCECFCRPEDTFINLSNQSEETNTDPMINWIIWGAVFTVSFIAFRTVISRYLTKKEQLM